jgi:hypothetical protein
MHMFCKCGDSEGSLKDMRKHIEDSNYSSRCSTLRDLPFYHRKNRIPHPMEDPPVLFDSFILTMNGVQDPLIMFEYHRDAVLRILKRQPKPSRICITSELVVSRNPRGYDEPEITNSDTLVLDHNSDFADVLETLLMSLRMKSIAKEILSTSSITLEVVH